MDIIILMVIAVAVIIAISALLWIKSQKQSDSNSYTKLKQSKAQNANTYWQSLLKNGKGQLVAETDEYSLYEEPDNQTKREIVSSEKQDDGYLFWTNDPRYENYQVENFDLQTSINRTEEKSYLLDYTIYKFDGQEVAHHTKTKIMANEELIRQLSEKQTQTQNFPVSDKIYNYVLICIHNNRPIIEWYKNENEGIQRMQEWMSFVLQMPITMNSQHISEELSFELTMQDAFIETKMNRFDWVLIKIPD